MLWMNEWMNEWMSEWMNEWVSEWMNELIKYWHDVNTGLYEIIIVITFISHLQLTIHSFIFFIHLFESGN